MTDNPQTRRDARSGVSPKITYAAGGAAVGSAASTITVWVINATTGLAVPGEVELALGVILTAGLAFLSGWAKRQ